MDLKLANDVVYAVLGTVVAIFLIVYTTRVIRIRAATRYELELAQEQQLYDHQKEVVQNTAPWPAITEEKQR